MCRSRASSLFPCGNFLLQLFKPVQHDVDLRQGRSLFAGLEHQEALAVGRHVVVGNRGPASARNGPSNSILGLPAEKLGCVADLYGHHLVAAAVEQFPPVGIPDWLRAAFRRDLPFPARSRIGLHVDFDSGPIHPRHRPASARQEKSWAPIR